jgi:hypothetical protein
MFPTIYATSWLSGQDYCPKCARALSGPSRLPLKRTHRPETTKPVYQRFYGFLLAHVTLRGFRPSLCVHEGLKGSC